MAKPTVTPCGDDTYVPSGPRLSLTTARPTAVVLFTCRMVGTALLFGLLVKGADDNPVRRIQDRFLAPCCWQQSVAVHDSDIAKQMRADIAGMVASGKSEDQIVDFYVARYGERILREPRGAYWWWSIVVPMVSIALATACLVLFLRRQRRETAVAANTADLPALPDVDLV